MMESTLQGGEGLCIQINGDFPQTQHGKESWAPGIMKDKVHQMLCLFWFQVIQMDAELLKEYNQKSTFSLDIEFVRNVLCGPSTLDHEENPRMGCQCYYCEKHWKKTGGPPCFTPPRCALFWLRRESNKSYFLKYTDKQTNKQTNNQTAVAWLL